MFASLLALGLSCLHYLSFLLGYLSSNHAFPKPLGPEEEQKYIQLAAQGDEDAKNVLIERNLRLVAHVAKKYSQSGYDPDDLISIGTIGLIKAIHSYNFEKKTKLATYAARCIEKPTLSPWLLWKLKGKDLLLFQGNGVCSAKPARICI